MGKKIVFFFIVSFLSLNMIFAQQNGAAIKFQEKQHNFGTFKEEAGKQIYAFEFLNTGSVPIIIKQVKSSCGCTSPSWTKTPVAPGKTGVIRAEYNPKNRPGPFNKSLTVISNTQPTTNILRIKGTVTPKVKTKKDQYPRFMSGLRLKSNHLSFTKVKAGKEKEAFMAVYNDSDVDIKVNFRRLPKHLNLKLEPAVLKPKQEGKIVGEYNAKIKNDWGFVTDYVDVLVNDKYEARNRLTISATIEDDFSALSAEQLAMAPKVQFDQSVFNFKELKQGESVEHIFILKNIGKSDLIIRKTKTTCGCTAVSPKSKIVKPGEQTDLKVIFNSRGKRGRQNKIITLITNDPKHASSRLKIVGNVLVKK